MNDVAERMAGDDDDAVKDERMVSAGEPEAHAAGSRSRKAYAGPHHERKSMF